MALADIMGKNPGKEDPESGPEFPDNDPDGPDPKAKRPEGGGRSHRRETPKVSAAAQKQIEKEIADLIELLALPLSLRDPICADALDESKDEVAKKAAVIICRNPRWAAWFQMEGFGTLMQWGGLAVALQPVAKTIIAHHVTHEIGQDEDGDDAQEDFDRYVAPRIAG